ncbi:hypothetical protein [Halobaculum sp. P14]|uniref:hypothetical protein n=1 Tax=Halobaculum sp. P14 TaxID=3421638 RepID=UPI003EBC4550
MRLEDVPVVGPLLAAGADDRTFDALLVAGAVLIPLIGAVGRNAVTTAFAVAYILVFLGYVAYNGVR